MRGIFLAVHQRGQSNVELRAVDLPRQRHFFCAAAMYLLLPDVFIRHMEMVRLSAISQSVLVQLQLRTFFKAVRAYFYPKSVRSEDCLCMHRFVAPIDRACWARH